MSIVNLPWIATLLCLAWTVVPARGNLGPLRKMPEIGEPVGIKNIAITNEELTIDLRPIGNRELARVDVVYKLHNSGLSQTQKLLFYSGSKLKNLTIQFDGAVIPNAVEEVDDIPPHWKGPYQSPCLYSLNSLGISTELASPASCEVTIPPGHHTLQVRFETATATNPRRVPTPYHQFLYVLSPARDWDGFGGIDVTIYLPRGWKTAVEPEMTRDGDTLRGKFATLPADAITLTTAEPAPAAYRIIVNGFNVTLTIVGLGGLWLCWRKGRLMGQRLAKRRLETGYLDHGIAAPAFGYGMLWSGSVVLLAAAAFLAPDLGIPSDDRSREYDFHPLMVIYGMVIMAIVTFILGFIGFLAALIAASRELKRGRRAAVPAQPSA